MLLNVCTFISEFSYTKTKSHINSINIPMGEVLKSIKLINKQKKVIIYCQSGNRSAAVVYMLKKHFQLDNIFSLEGGYTAYQNFKQKTVEF